MSDATPVSTEQLHNWVDRLRAGDRAAADDLLRATCGRLERLARRMLRDYPNVKRWADTGDVVQVAMVRLLKALESIRPASTREYFGLAALQIRRRLLDLARHFGGPRGLGTKHKSLPPGDGATPLDDVPDPHTDAYGLDLWQQFHEAVERLPDDEREVVSLAFYHGWTHARIAELLQVSERTVRRYWQSACVRLADALGGRMPDLGGRAG